MESYGYQPSAVADPGVYSEPTEKVSLYISCQNLANMDMFSKSDPCVEVFFSNDGRAESFEFIGKTETIENNLNPEFVTAFDISFYFERNQKIKFFVYDIDVASKEFIGSAETSMAKIMGSPKQTFSSEITNKSGKCKGKITVRLEKVSLSNDVVHFTAKAFHLPTKKKLILFGYDKPFYFIERTRSPDSNEYIRVLQSDAIKGTVNPIWPKMKYSVSKLCNGEEDNQLVFKMYRWSDKGHHKPYGKITTSLRRLKSGELEYPLHKMDTDEIIPKSSFTFSEFYIEERPSFFDFLNSGWQMNMSVAVDFTGSNGEVSSPLSLHYRNPTGQLNQYETALLSVSSILVNYDSDQLIPAFGFGGVPGFLGSRVVSHCFHLNGGENPQCQSVKGLMEAYQFSLANVSLSGPTYFAPFLKVFYDFAIANVSNPIYHIIMILTDGDIHDTTNNKFSQQ